MKYKNSFCSSTISLRFSLCQEYAILDMDMFSIQMNMIYDTPLEINPLFISFVKNHMQSRGPGEQDPGADVAGGVYVYGGGVWEGGLIDWIRLDDYAVVCADGGSERLLVAGNLPWVT